MSARLRPALLRTTLVVASLFLTVHLVLPQVAGLRSTAERLAAASWWLLLAALVLETASFTAYGELCRSVLASGGTRVGRSLAQRVTIVGASLGKTLPGGTTAASAVTVRALTGQGVPAAAAVAGLGAAGVLSSAVLGLLLLPASASAVASGHVTGLVLGALGAAGAVVVVAGLVPLAVRSPERVAGRVRRGLEVVARGPVRRWVDPQRSAALVEAGIRSLRALTRDRRGLAAAAAWASANWLTDLAVLLTLAVAFGVGGAVLSVPLVYVIGQLTAAVPLTPGGVGVMETVMIGALTAAGSPAAGATAAVLGWRLISHWLPILVGLAFLPSVLHRRPGPAAIDRPIRP